MKFKNGKKFVGMTIVNKAGQSCKCVDTHDNRSIVVRVDDSFDVVSSIVDFVDNTTNLHTRGGVYYPKQFVGSFTEEEKESIVNMYKKIWKKRSTDILENIVGDRWKNFNNFLEDLVTLPGYSPETLKDSTLYSVFPHTETSQSNTIIIPKSMERNFSKFVKIEDIMNIYPIPYQKNSYHVRMVLIIGAKQYARTRSFNYPKRDYVNAYVEMLEKHLFPLLGEDLCKIATVYCKKGIEEMKDLDTIITKEYFNK